MAVCPSDFYVSIGDEDAIEENIRAGSAADEETAGASADRAVDTAPRRTRRTINKVASSKRKRRLAESSKLEGTLEKDSSPNPSGAARYPTQKG
ncbi:hypothetical protein BS78_07G065100 [Paspalum vaginatum]|nr:hypothetical protein BS78_07G065100 [Paspalum vaginatum]KAJ1267551.1 hypothetical protein BS78_07G065100 [Paspalum vaginatum]KAJ1267553.1 hypothetical protein BS78_07G065100 [Paspalum vaginatum]